MITPAEKSLTPLLSGSPYVAYSYSYPHKTAYRPLSQKLRLAEAWQAEKIESLFLYLHVPFCEFRCGFCNLFTLSQPSSELPDRYLSQLERQAKVLEASLPQAKFARLAIGGGTPTFFDIDQLTRLLNVFQPILNVDTKVIPFSIEASPATIDYNKIKLLEDAGVDRLSLGVQSFDASDAKSIGRPQKPEIVARALELARASSIPNLNIDLIYGGETQGISSWCASLETALSYQPEELYLYPLYVRPLTGLGRLNHQWDDWRLHAYREGRSLLLDRGYEQISMRMFRRIEFSSDEGPIYCCQQDGMMGLGCGARSYTNQLHYSNEYAVGSRGTKNILANYLQKSSGAFSEIDYGYLLDEEDRKRRYLILGILQVAGLSRDSYLQQFQTDVVEDFPELTKLVNAGLAELNEEQLRLSERGVELSDAIGPWLYSGKAKRLMEDYRWIQ